MINTIKMVLSNLWSLAHLAYNVRIILERQGYTVAIKPNIKNFTLDVWYNSSFLKTPTHIMWNLGD